MTTCVHILSHTQRVRMFLHFIQYILCYIMFYPRSGRTPTAKAAFQETGRTPGDNGLTPVPLLLLRRCGRARWYRSTDRNIIIIIILGIGIG